MKQKQKAPMLAKLTYTKRKSKTTGSGRSKKFQSLAAAAKEIGVSTSTVCRVERGEIPTTENLLKFCKWLGVTFEFAIEGFNAENAIEQAMEHTTANA